MSIDDELSPLPSVTEGGRALQLFTDRYEFTRLFAAALNSDPPRSQILFFHGDGGNGKSLLLKFLRQRCCKRLSRSLWQQVQGRSDGELATYLEKLQPTECLPIPAALLDFGMQLIGSEQPQNPFYGLLMLRRNLAEAAAELKYRLRFPLYDFACIWYLHKKGKSPEEIKSLFPLSDVAGGISTLIDVVSRNAFGAIAKAALDFFVEGLEEQVTVQLAKRGLNNAKVQAICQKEVDTELIDELPKLLAQDLNAAMRQQTAPARLVLFFDTHEAFWGQQKNLPETLFFQRDEWLRQLLRALDLQAGIVAVVAGREAPRWALAAAAKPQSEIPARFLLAKPIGHLATADAGVYLQRVGIHDLALAARLIAYASVQAGEVHPLYLGLAADVVLQAEAQGTRLTAADFAALPPEADPSKVLIERLLRYVEPEIRAAVHALSACRAFNFELYRLLGQALDFAATRAAFTLLTQFSFVWQTERQGQAWLRIHDLLRRLDQTGSEEMTQRAHAVLEQHYRSQGETAEAIYHANRLEWRRGVEEWVQVFDAALQRSRYGECLTLLEVRRELMILSDFQLGSVSGLEGSYFAQLSRHAEAGQEYREAIAAYEQALQLAPDDIQIFNNKGIALKSLANLQAKLSQHPQAVEHYQVAIAAYEQALQLAPDDIYALNNKGSVLKSLADLQAKLSQHPQAVEHYQAAIAAYEQALQLAPDDIQILNNKGLALQRLTDLQVKLSQHPQAVEHYQAAIAAYEQALQLAPDDIQILNNKGLALLSLANLQATRGQAEAAAQNYLAALAAWSRSLQLAPNDQIVCNWKDGLQAFLEEMSSS